MVREKTDEKQTTSRPDKLWPEMCFQAKNEKMLVEIGEVSMPAAMPCKTSLCRSSRETCRTFGGHSTQHACIG